MPAWDKIFLDLAQGWGMVSAHPFFFIPVFGLIIYLCIRGTASYYKNQRKQDSADLGSKDDTLRLLKARVEGLKAEADGYRTELANTQILRTTALLPVIHGNDAIKKAFDEMFSTREPIIFSTVSNSINGAEQYASFVRLQEVGLANIEQISATTSVATATPTARSSPPLTPATPAIPPINN